MCTHSNDTPGFTQKNPIDLIKDLQKQINYLSTQVESLEKQLEEPKFNVNIKYFDKDLVHIQEFAQGDWIDLRAAEDVDIPKFTRKKISLGIAMELPDGYEAHVVPRSSTCKNFFVLQTNHFGVIDNSYKGNNDCWFVELYAIEDTHISKNDRICQFRIDKKMPKIKFVEVENLGNPNRGGWGSTGTK